VTPTGIGGAVLLITVLILALAAWVLQRGPAYAMALAAVVSAIAGLVTAFHYFA
jgi:hypothetical protein